MRTIRKIMPADRVNMGGILLDQPLPSAGIDQIDPFLLLHHAKHRFEGGERQANAGVGPHPHRGFSPVTFIFEGGVYHQDSRGNKGLIEKGGTQWMNSGMGIIHSERPSKKIAEEGGDQEIIQFWVNTPAKHKMDQPSYQPLSAEDTPTILSDDGKVRTAVVCGEFGGETGKIKAATDILALRLEMQKDGELTIPIPEHFNAFVYQLDGHLKINDDQYATMKDLTFFNNDGDSIKIKAEQDTRLILLAGEPIGEEVTQYGPFVMNTQTEVLEAMRDYQMGKMGILVEEFV